MHKEFHHDAVRRLQSLIERETGTSLSDAAQAEMASILHGMQSPDGGASEGLDVVPREGTK